MSRSALEKKMRQEQYKAKTAATAAVASSYSLSYSQASMTNLSIPYEMYSTTAALYNPTMYANQFVPLVGDDEDFEETTKTNALPIHGNSKTFNINTLLYDNIMSNDYFKALYQLRTYHEVIAEIQRVVQNVEPWYVGTSRHPSSAFCLLVKFMVMRLTMKQMTGLLEMKGFPMVRAIGFLYLRYTAPPTDLWRWFEPYLEDDETFAPSADQVVISFGIFLKKLLTEMQYYGTTLPRIPVPIERKIKVLLLLLDEKMKRRQENMKILKKNPHLFNVGETVMAIYADEENEPAWYEARIDAQDEESTTKYWVTFPEYGNSECVDLGNIKLINEKMKEIERDSHAREDDRDGHDSKTNIDKDDRRRGDSRDARRRSRDDRENSRERYTKDHYRGRSRDRTINRSRSRSPNTSKYEYVESQEDLMKKVIESERAASAAVGRNYAQRPISYKGSLSLKADSYGVRKRSPHRERENERSGRKRSRTPSPNLKYHSRISGQQEQDRMKMLKEKYGDASTLNK
jgi:pre-mRNA-splicing factor 38B